MEKNKIIIIAEAASNHLGDIERAKEMVWQAKNAGADYIKFQSWQVKYFTSSDQTLYQRFRKRELSDENHFILIEECKKAGINFLTTCFNIERIPFLKSLGLETIKVGSGDVTSIKMLKLLRENFKHIIFSTGMATDQEVEKGVEALKPGEFYLLHCVSLYPTPLEMVNLARMNWLKKFTNRVGFSDHTIGTEAAKIALAQGAKIIEKHFTLKIDHNDKFSIICATPEMLKEIVLFKEVVLKCLGKEHRELTEEEWKVREIYVGLWGDNK